MKNVLRVPVIALLFSAALLSCNNYGKKIKVEGTKAEIYYKDGATEEDAKKLGDFLKQDEFINDKKATSIQVLKENGGYTVRFVYSKDYYDKNEGIEKSFKEYAAKISKDVFNGNKVNIALADNKFKDFKTIPYQQPVEAVVETGLAPAAPSASSLDTKEYDHDKAGGVTFFWKGISVNQSKIIADYIVQNGAFAGGTAEIYMTKEGDRFILRFPVKEEYRNDPEIIAEVEKVAKLIKQNVFVNDPYSFQMVDEKLNAVKSFDY
jgi:hypothetical protein